MKTKRDIKTIKCEICKNKYKSIGMATHLQSTHDMTIDDYVLKYDEFRKKKIHYKKNESGDYICKICDKKCMSERHLSFHVKTHGITKEDYILKYIMDNKKPICECGCGTELKIFKHKPYTTRFVTGHNVYMHLGMVRSDESKMRMRKAAIKRIKAKKGVYFYNGVSKEEIKLRKFIETHVGGVIHNDTNILNGLELDIYIPSLKLAIELNGDRFHSDLFKDKWYHLNKTKECEKQGIQLIHIWMCDWIQKNEIIKSILLNKLGKTNTKIFGRKTEIREVQNKECSLFLNENHLQGQSISSIRLGLFHDNQLVQIMTFGKLRKATGLDSKAGSYELIRMCSKKNTNVIGGSNKLLKYFIEKYKPKRIISYANRDWSNGNVYEKLGFTFVKYTTPGYFYTKSHIKYHRFKFQKHKLIKEGYDKSKTEYEIMTDRGFYKIWNTGNFLFEYNVVC